MTHREKTKNMHNESQSTFLGHNPSVIQQQLEVFSNLFGKDGGETASQKKTLPKKNSIEKQHSKTKGGEDVNRETNQTALEKQFAKKFKDK